MGNSACKPCRPDEASPAQRRKRFSRKAERQRQPSVTSAAPIEPVIEPEHDDVQASDPDTSGSTSPAVVHHDDEYIFHATREMVTTNSGTINHAGTAEHIILKPDAVSPLSVVVLDQTRLDTRFSTLRTPPDGSLRAVMSPYTCPRLSLSPLGDAIDDANTRRANNQNAAATRSPGDSDTARYSPRHARGTRRRGASPTATPSPPHHPLPHDGPFADTDDSPLARLRATDDPTTGDDDDISLSSPLADSEHASSRAPSASHGARAARRGGTLTNRAAPRAAAPRDARNTASSSDAPAIAAAAPRGAQSRAIADGAIGRAGNGRAWGGTRGAAGRGGSHAAAATSAVDRPHGGAPAPAADDARNNDASRSAAESPAASREARETAEVLRAELAAARARVRELEAAAPPAGAHARLPLRPSPMRRDAPGSQADAAGAAVAAAAAAGDPRIGDSAARGAVHGVVGDAAAPLCGVDVPGLAAHAPGGHTRDDEDDDDDDDDPVAVAGIVPMRTAGAARSAGAGRGEAAAAEMAGRDGGGAPRAPVRSRAPVPSDVTPGEASLVGTEHEGRGEATGAGADAREGVDSGQAHAATLTHGRAEAPSKADPQAKPSKPDGQGEPKKATLRVRQTARTRAAMAATRVAAAARRSGSAARASVEPLPEAPTVSSAPAAPQAAGADGHALIASSAVSTAAARASVSAAHARTRAASHTTTAGGEPGPGPCLGARLLAELGGPRYPSRSDEAGTRNPSDEHSTRPPCGDGAGAAAGLIGAGAYPGHTSVEISMDDCNYYNNASASVIGGVDGSMWGVFGGGAFGAAGADPDGGSAAAAPFGPAHHQRSGGGMRGPLSGTVVGGGRAASLGSGWRDVSDVGVRSSSLPPLGTSRGPTGGGPSGHPDGEGDQMRYSTLRSGGVGGGRDVRTYTCADDDDDDDAPTTMPRHRSASSGAITATNTAPIRATALSQRVFAGPFPPLGTTHTAGAGSSSMTTTGDGLAGAAAGAGGYRVATLAGSLVAPGAAGPRTLTLGTGTGLGGGMGAAMGPAMGPAGAMGGLRGGLTLGPLSAADPAAPLRGLDGGGLFSAAAVAGTLFAAAAADARRSADPRAPAPAPPVAPTGPTAHGAAGCAGAAPLPHHPHHVAHTLPAGIGGTHTSALASTAAAAVGARGALLGRPIAPLPTRPGAHAATLPNTSPSPTAVAVQHRPLAGGAADAARGVLAPPAAAGAAAAATAVQAAAFRWPTAGAPGATGPTMSHLQAARAAARPRSAQLAAALATAGDTAGASGHPPQSNHGALLDAHSALRGIRESGARGATPSSSPPADVPELELVITVSPDARHARDTATADIAAEWGGSAAGTSRGDGGRHHRTGRHGRHASGTDEDDRRARHESRHRRRHASDPEERHAVAGGGALHATADPSSRPADGSVVPRPSLPRPAVALFDDSAEWDASGCASRAPRGPVAQHGLAVLRHSEGRGRPDAHTHVTGTYPHQQQHEQEWQQGHHRQQIDRADPPTAPRAVHTTTRRPLADVSAISLNAPPTTSAPRGHGQWHGAGTKGAESAADSDGEWGAGAGGLGGVRLLGSLAALASRGECGDYTVKAKGFADRRGRDGCDDPMPPMGQSDVRGRAVAESHVASSSHDAVQRSAGAGMMIGSLSVLALR